MVDTQMNEKFRISVVTRILLLAHCYDENETSYLARANFKFLSSKQTSRRTFMIDLPWITFFTRWTQIQRKGLRLRSTLFLSLFFGQKHNEKQIINTAWSAWMEKEKEHRIQWNSPTSFAYERDRFHWSSKRKRRCLRQPSNTRHYLRAESAATAVDYTPEGLVASVRQHVSFQPPSRTGTPPLHLAALPLADEIITSGLRVDVRYLKRSSLSMNNISEPRTVARHGVARCCNEIISSGYSVAM